MYDNWNVEVWEFDQYKNKPLSGILWKWSFLSTLVRNYQARIVLFLTESWTFPKYASVISLSWQKSRVHDAKFVQTS